MGKSIVDVAKHAGLSPSTVARVANGSPLVAESTVQRVRSAMQELGYEPAPPALRRGPKTETNQGLRTRSIAMLLVGMEEALVTRLTAPGPLARALSEHGLNLIYVPMPDPTSLPPIVNRKQIDGVVIQGLEPIGKAAEILRKMPVVWMLTRRSESFWGDSVEPDNRAIGEMAAVHLLERNHKHLACVNIQPNYPAFRSRGQAFAAHAKSAGASVAIIQTGPVILDPGLHFSPDQDVVDQHVDKLFSSKPRPTGYFVSTQLPYVYAAFGRLGVEPGKDIEIIVGDDVSKDFPWIRPRPAYIEVGLDTIAHRAVDQLIWRMKHPDEPGAVRLSVSPKLVAPVSAPISGVMTACP